MLDADYPQASAAAGARGAGRVFGTAWLVWIVFLFAGTFTVAYAFVPGAWSFREHTDLCGFLPSFRRGSRG
jgi:hypothetical protein